jgi:hypothetical protein
MQRHFELRGSFGSADSPTGHDIAHPKAAYPYLDPFAHRADFSDYTDYLDYVDFEEEDGDVVAEEDGDEDTYEDEDVEGLESDDDETDKLEEGGAVDAEAEFLAIPELGKQVRVLSGAPAHAACACHASHMLLGMQPLACFLMG